MRLANTVAGARTIRLRAPGAVALPAGQLVPGTMLTVTQGTAPDTNSDTQVVESVISEMLAEARGYLSRDACARGSASARSRSDGGSTDGTSNEFNLTVSLGAVSRHYDRLSMDPAHPRYLITIVNGDPAGLLDAS